MSAERLALVTGANGFVGSALTRHLDGRGWRVRAATRTGGPSPAGAMECAAVGEIDGSTDWTSALAGVDTVFHVAGRAHVLRDTAANPLDAFRTVNRDGTLALARAAQEAGIRRFIFVSTIGVNGSETRGVPLSIGDLANPHSPYAISKWEAEQGLAALTSGGSMDHVVIRPPLILGPDPKGNLGTLLRAIRKGVPLPFGLIRNNRRDLVSLPVLCDLLATVADHPAASNKRFLVSDGFSRSTRAIIEELARMDGRKALFLPVPSPLLAASLRLMGRAALASQLCGDLEIDTALTCDTLRWEPPRPGCMDRKWI